MYVCNIGLHGEWGWPMMWILMFWIQYGRDGDLQPGYTRAGFDTYQHCMDAGTAKVKQKIGINGVYHIEIYYCVQGIIVKQHPTSYNLTPEQRAGWAYALDQSSRQLSEIGIPWMKK